MGEAYVREFVKNGYFVRMFPGLSEADQCSYSFYRAFVTYCDLNEERGKAIEAELTP